jgi:hypothetical protein
MYSVQDLRLVLRHLAIDVARERRQRALALQRLVHFIGISFAVLPVAGGAVLGVNRLPTQRRAGMSGQKAHQPQQQVASKATHDPERIRGEPLDFSRENSLRAQIRPSETLSNKLFY